MPCKCRRLLTWRIHSLQSPDGRVLHARVSLRRQHGREPSPDEIEEWLKVNTARHQGISQSALEAAFGSGEEVRLMFRSALSISLMSCAMLRK